MSTNNPHTVEKATFAGGCFWCMVSFEELPGILKVRSGYTGGHTENPTYEEVCSETTGHVEAVQITFDPQVFPYEKLLELFWQQIDPTDEGGQFHDRGSSYQTAIFYHNEEQRIKAEASKEALAQSGASTSPLLHRSCLRPLFMKQKNIIRTIIRRTPLITSATAKVRDVKILSSKIGPARLINPILKIG